MIGKSLLYKVLPLFSYFQTRYYIGMNGVLYERIGNKYRITYCPNSYYAFNPDMWFYGWKSEWDPPQSNGGLQEISENKYKMLMALRDR